MCAGAHATAHVEVIGQSLGVLSPSTMWVPEIKFSLSGSLASAFTQGTCLRMYLYQSIEMCL